MKECAVRRVGRLGGGIPFARSSGRTWTTHRHSGRPHNMSMLDRFRVLDSLRTMSCFDVPIRSVCPKVLAAHSITHVKVYYSSVSQSLVAASLYPSQPSIWNVSKLQVEEAEDFARCRALHVHSSSTTETPLRPHRYFHKYPIRASRNLELSASVQLEVIFAWKGEWN